MQTSDHMACIPESPWDVLAAIGFTTIEVWTKGSAGNARSASGPGRAADGATCMGKLGQFVEDTFGFAGMRVVSFADLYAGKIVAALDRQHPRDLFDVRLLMANEGIADQLRLPSSFISSAITGLLWNSLRRRASISPRNLSADSGE